MARYDREFLVQYTCDIYALYITRNKIQGEISECSNLISVLKRGLVSNPRPESPRQYALGAKYYVFLPLVILCILLDLLVGARLMEIGWSESSVLQNIFVAALLLIVVCVFMMYKEKKRVNKANHEIQETYEKEWEKYRSLEAKNEQHRKRIPAYQEQIVSYQQEIQRIDSLLDKLYNVNILPIRYRDFYAVVYLHDYFSHSRENDLAMALNTYVLEQIKERLDYLISQMSDVILNQYIIMDNQRAAMEQIERHHAEICGKLNQIEASNEERNMYLEMIEANTATLKYFVTAEYIKNW